MAFDDEKDEIVTRLQQRKKSEEIKNKAEFDHRWLGRKIVRYFER